MLYFQQIFFKWNFPLLLFVNWFWCFDFQHICHQFSHSKKLSCNLPVRIINPKNYFNACNKFLITKQLSLIRLCHKYLQTYIHNSTQAYIISFKVPIHKLQYNKSLIQNKNVRIKQVVLRKHKCQILQNKCLHAAAKLNLVTHSLP